MKIAALRPSEHRWPGSRRATGRPCEPMRRTRVDIVEEFVDHGYSGAKERRPALDRIDESRLDGTVPSRAGLAVRSLCPFSEAPPHRLRAVSFAQYQFHFSARTVRHLDADWPRDVHHHWCNGPT